MPEQDFESAFSTLAFAELEQKIPTLMPHIVGFQLIEKNDNDTRAVGVFGFNIGKQWFYIPVFWLNGRIKGYQLLYIVGQDMFVPMSEEWINFLKNKQPYEMGKKYVKDVNDLGYLAPDFTLYRRSPLTKAGSWKEALKPLEDQGNSWLGMLDASESRATSGLDLLKKASTRALTSVLKDMNKDHKYAEAMFNFYDPPKFKEAADIAIGTKYWKAAADKVEPGVTPNENLRIDENPKPVKIIYSDGTDQGLKSFTQLNNKEQERQMAGKIVIRDDRNDAEVATVRAKPDFTRVYDTVGRSGYFRVINEDGEGVPALVGDVIVIGAAKYPKLQVIVDTVNKKFLTTEPGDVYSSAELEPALWQAEYDKMPAMSDVKIGDFGVMVDKQSRRVSIPFEVKKKVTNSTSGITSLEVSVYDDFEKSDFSKIQREDGQYGKEPVHSSISDCIEYDYRKYTHPPVIKVLKGDHKVSPVNNATIVGEGAKFFRLGSLSSARKEYNKSHNYELIEHTGDALNYDLISKFAFNPGSHKLMDMAIQKVGMTTLSMELNDDDGLKVRFGGESHNLAKRACIRYLVERVNLREETAEALVKQAQRGKGQHLIKRATFFKSAVIMPGFEPSKAYDDVYGAPVQYSWEDSQVVPTSFQDENTQNPKRNSSQNPYSSTLENADMPDSRESALLAAKNGQKEVFDVSLLMNLVRSSGLEDMIRDYAKDIIVGNDRIGRLLFAFYWHFDDIADRYGEDEMTEFEGLLTDVFASTGELVLFLSKKSVAVNEQTLNPVFG